MQYQLIPPKNDSISSHLYFIWLYIVHVLVLDFVRRSDGHFFWHLRCYMLKSWILQCCSFINISMRYLGHPFIFAAREMWTYCFTRQCRSNPDAVISYPIVSPEMIPCAREADNPWFWMAANPPPALLSLLSPPTSFYSPPTHFSNSKPGTLPLSGPCQLSGLSSAPG